MVTVLVGEMGTTAAVNETRKQKNLEINGSELGI